jgi:hypothetical protein
LSVAKGNFGIKKVEAPSKNPKKCPIMCFAPDKKIIFCTSRISGTLVFLCPKEKEREEREEREERKEREEGEEREWGREGERERERARAREKEKERERGKKVRAILNRRDQSEILKRAV